ncbi:acetylornithine deacetylase [Roseovarius sp. EL26]|uniref:acetylornithine deacetylase n=1 Tax=Roseovarius sp. EL26 TaxID=2126672 RepID=UPI000EA09889|nr:acetylornithine deacetylase [Roseovarius sp. EL26]
MTQTLDILDRLIGFNTISANSNLDIIAYIEEFLCARGFEVTHVPDETGQKAGLYAVLGPAANGAGVMLSAHTDVVPVAGQDWSKDPFKLTREGGRLYGRGTTDMKGYVASVMALADRASKTQLNEPLKIAFSYDEEVGCVGIKKMIDRLESSIGLPRVCFVGEPTEMQVAIGHKGKAALRATCHGQAGHSALAPQFLNALHLATDFVGELRDFQADLARNGAHDAAYGVPYSTIHVGKLSGGTALNIVPDTAIIDFEYRHLAADKPADILARVMEAAERVSCQRQAAFPDAKIDVEQYNDYPGLDVAAEAAIVPYAQKLAQTNSVTKVAFGTEAGYFDGLGIPTVVCGPGSMEGQGHKPDEYITLEQLNVCDAMMDRILQDLKG